MKKIISLGICLCLLTVMLLTACEDAQTTSGGEVSSPSSSQNVNTETSSDDASSNNSLTPSEPTSSKETSSKNESKKEDSVSTSEGKDDKKYDVVIGDQYFVEAIIKQEYKDKTFSLSDFPEVDVVSIDVGLREDDIYINFYSEDNRDYQGARQVVQILENNKYVESVEIKQIW